MFEPSCFTGIRSADVHRVAPELMPLLREFEEQTCVAVAEEVIEQAKRRASQLWTYHDGEKLRCVVATTVNEGVRRKGCLVWVCVGHEFLELATGVLSAIENWAQSIGCTHVEIVGRKGWGRVIEGYRRAAVVLEKRLMETY